MNPAYISIGYWAAILIAMFINVWLLLRLAAKESAKFKIYFYTIGGLALLLSALLSMFASAYVMGTVFAIISTNQFELSTAGSILAGSPFGIFTAFFIMYFAVRLTKTALQKSIFAT